MARRKFTEHCNECGGPFRTRDTRQKFCGLSCANRHNSRGRKLSETTRKKVSASLREYYSSQTNRDQHRQRTAARDEKNRGRRQIDSLMEASSRTRQKIMRRLGLPCSRCGWQEAVCDIHHIGGKKILNAESHENLTYLCPNCHRMAHAGLIDPKDMVTLVDYVGDDWKEVYYG